MKTALLIIGLVGCVSLAACDRPEDSQRALEDAGYKNIHITGYRILGCDKNDTFHTGFEAEGQTGRHVSGVVCSGVFKGSTIRTD